MGALTELADGAFGGYVPVPDSSETYSFLTKGVKTLWSYTVPCGHGSIRSLEEGQPRKSFCLDSLSSPCFVRIPLSLDFRSPTTPVRGPGATLCAVGGSGRGWGPFVAGPGPLRTGYEEGWVRG